MAHDDRGNDVTAVAIDKDKNSQFAVKWACDNLVGNNPTLLLIHVRARNPESDVSMKPNLKSDEYSKQLFLPYRGFCARKGVQVKEVLLDDTDIVEAIVSYVKTNSINNIVVGASARNLFTRRLRNIDVPSTLMKAAPDFCSLYVIGKGKVVTIRTATQPPPPRQPMQQSSIAMPPQLAAPEVHEPEDKAPPPGLGRGGGSWPSEGSRQPSTTSTENHDHTPSMYTLASSYNSREGMARVTDFASLGFEFSNSSTDSPPYSSSSQLTPSVEAEMMRLKQELKQTMDMYSSACREAITAKQKAVEFQQWKMDEARKFEQARLAEEAALALAKMEKAKCKAAMEAAEASQRLAELEAKKRLDAEMKAQTEAEERSKVLNALANSNLRYRRYSMEEINGATENLSESLRIGEGGYGPVYRANLDHTQVAIKLLRSDAAQGMKQFQQEVEVLSSIRHPNMVLLLGACPESGCLVYEYMDNGSLDDRLFRRGGTPPIPWWTRFKIAAEIATGLLFLHQTKPEPLVHRDLKPANILLDHNYTSKISDVGLARLVPPCIADSVTQYHMTSAAGTFCYIDPEYQQTGMLGTKSDVYSLGIMLLQIITAKSPMGLAHTMERAIEKGTFEDILDPTVPDWPIEDTLSYAKMALKCSELRKKDRPDLATEILPELNRLRGVGFTSTGQNSYHPPTSYSTISHVRQLNSDDGSQHPNSN